MIAYIIKQRIDLHGQEIRYEYYVKPGIWSCNLIDAFFMNAEDVNDNLEILTDFGEENTDIFSIEKYKITKEENN